MELEYFIEISKHVVVIINYYCLKEETSGLVIAVDFLHLKGYLHDDVFLLVRPKFI